MAERLEDTFVRSCWHFRKFSLLHNAPGLTRAETWILLLARKAELHDPDGIVRVGEITEKTGATASGTSRTIRSLEKKGLVVRYQDPDDRRVTLLRITDDGEAVMAEAHRKVAAFLQELIRCLGEEKIRELIRLQDELCAETEKLRKSWDWEAGRPKAGSPADEEKTAAEGPEKNVSTGGKKL